MLPMAYVYPREMRATRDLLRRRCHFMAKRAELLTHIQNTASQYTLAPFGKKLAYKANRTDVAGHFPDPEVRKSIETNLALLDHYDRLLTDLELHLTRRAKVHDVNQSPFSLSRPAGGHRWVSRPRRVYCSPLCWPEASSGSPDRASISVWCRPQRLTPPPEMKSAYASRARRACPSPAGTTPLPRTDQFFLLTTGGLIRVRHHVRRCHRRGSRFACMQATITIVSP